MPSPSGQHLTLNPKTKLSLRPLCRRAAETNNVGQKLRDGANINRSLLALANCINALGKNAKTGAAYVSLRVACAAP
jgi:hypothetical protein